MTDAILDAVHPGIDLVFLCQPNNPTGQLARPALVEALLRRCEAVGAVLAVDECFLDFLPEGQSLSATRLLSTSRSLVILKAFTKLYGMAGVRLGYALRASRGRFPVWHRRQASPRWTRRNMWRRCVH